MSKSQNIFSKSRLLIIFLILSLILSVPFMYRTLKIHEVYTDSNIRGPVLDSVFFLRNQYGLTIGDLTIKDVERKQDVLYVTIHEKYHGIIDYSDYDDINQDYVLSYNLVNETIKLVKIVKRNDIAFNNMNYGG